jgi:DNA modification methylase
VHAPADRQQLQPRGQAVYEPFSGAGATLIAAETTRRTCHAIELSPAYVDVAVQRWRAFTGKQATLERRGEAFAAVAAARLGKDEEEAARAGDAV